MKKSLCNSLKSAFLWEFLYFYLYILLLLYIYSNEIDTSNKFGNSDKNNVLQILLVKFCNK